MDLEEDWEYLSDDGNENGKKLISRDPNSIIDMDYFGDLQKKVSPDPIRVSIPPNPVEFESPKPSPPDDSVVKEVISIENSPVPLKIRDNQFADMKLDSPKSIDSEFTPKIELENPQLEDSDQKECENEKVEGGLNLWKMSMTGIGALCSFGFAFATIFVIALGNRHNREIQQDQKHRFKIYAHDKRIKRVVHRAAKLNEAIHAMREAPVSRAHISIGGYYESL